MTDDGSVIPMDHHQTVSVVAAVAPVGETTENGPDAKRFTADMPDLDPIASFERPRSREYSDFANSMVSEFRRRSSAQA